MTTKYFDFLLQVIIFFRNNDYFVTSFLILIIRIYSAVVNRSRFSGIFVSFLTLKSASNVSPPHIKTFFHEWILNFMRCFY